MNSLPTLDRDRAEEQRLVDLEQSKLLDTVPEIEFDRVTKLAATLFDAPIALVSLVDQRRQWFKSNLGLNAKETERSISFCQYTIGSDDVFYVEDALHDKRFAENPLVTGYPHIRTYVGAPVRGPAGQRIGSLCIIFDRVTQHGPETWARLKDLADIVSSEIALRSSLEAAEHAKRARADFLAMMSHEIRTPMNGILGSLSAIETHGEPENEELISLAEESAERLTRIVNDVLDVSKLDAGKLEFVPQITDLPTLLKRKQTIFGLEAAKKGLHFQAVRTGATTHVLVDDGRIRQVINNLASNAIAATSAGGVRLKVCTEDRGVGNPRLVIRVIDTGKGIPPDQIARIAEPFFQVDDGCVRENGGTGLGLAIVKMLAELMGGDFKIRSKRGLGTVATFEVPAPVVAEVSQSTINLRRGIHSNISGCAVLLAEDNEVNQRVMRAVLSDQVGALKIVNDGRAAVNAVESESFDLILLDIQMPRLDGVNAVREIRDLHTERGEKAIYVALTANAMPDQVSAYYRAGFDSVVTKPVQKASLRDLLTNLVLREKA